MSGGVFINYRGADSHSYGALLYTELVRQFGADLVFLDSESIPAGADFVDQLLTRVRASRVLLAVIGPKWLTTTAADGRRIDDPADWVRRELVEAFSAGVRVIPVLTDEASLPATAVLPVEIGKLGRCQYRRLRHRDATADLERLHADLVADPILGAAARRRSAESPVLAVVPAQLPADVYGFAGRAEYLGRLDAPLAEGVGHAPTAVVITAVSGIAGAGKTALAVHWAHRVAERFPDGQLYVNLHGFDPDEQVMPTAEAIRGFLDALDVPAARIPTELDAQAGLYRSLLRGRRVLVVLDNARDADHARPLLPGTSTALAIVTSRNQLTGLVVQDGARPFVLDVLPHEEAHELLARRIGAGRVAAEPAAVGEIITACARLPLALAIVAARAATHPTFSLTSLAAEVAEVSGKSGRLDDGNLVAQVRAVFSWSYATLSRPAARLFRLLGLHAGADISVAAAASLAAAALPKTRQLLAELAHAGLLSEHSPGRYSFHDLLAAYASDLTHSRDSEQTRRAATTRLLDYYLHTTHAAARLLEPTRDPMPLALAQPAAGTIPERPADDQAALDWLTVEHSVLLAALRQAAGAGFDTHAWQLTWNLATFLDRRGYWHELANAWQATLSIADRLAHPSATAEAHRELAWAGILLGHYTEAHIHLDRALELHVEAGNLAGQAHTLYALGWLLDREDRTDRSLDLTQQALALYRAASHRRGQAYALSGLGWHYARLGDYKQTLYWCRQALALHQQDGDRWGEAASWDSLGYAHFHLGQSARAAESYQHALALFRTIGDRHWEATVLTRLGDTHHADGQPDAARTAWALALSILTDLDHPDADIVRTKLNPDPPSSSGWDAWNEDAGAF